MITDEQIAYRDAEIVDHEARRLMAKYRHGACLRAVSRSMQPGDYHDRIADRILYLERMGE